MDTLTCIILIALVVLTYLVVKELQKSREEKQITNPVPATPPEPPKPKIPLEVLEQIAEGEFPDEIFQTIDQRNFPIILRKGERGIGDIQGVRLAVQKSIKVASGGSYSVRVMSGIWYHTGQIAPPVYQDQLKDIAFGKLVFTDQRVVFVGAGKSVDQPYSKINAVQTYSDGIAVSATNRQQVYFFLQDGTYWPLYSALITGLSRKLTRL